MGCRLLIFVYHISFFQFPAFLAYTRETKKNVCSLGRYKEPADRSNKLGPVVQSVVSLTSSLRVISLTVLADSIFNILIFNILI